jgi:Fe-S cluster assembly iron-binding protein IscA
MAEIVAWETNATGLRLIVEAVACQFLHATAIDYFKLITSK